MAIEILPDWLSNLENEDVGFIKKFVLSSGSLKDMAKIYGVTYPTVRLRLDRIIHKIQLNDNETKEPYVSLVKKLALDEKIDLSTANLLINEYKKTMKNNQ